MSWSIPAGSALLASGVDISAINATGWAVIQWIKTSSTVPRSSMTDGGGESGKYVRFLDIGEGMQAAKMVHGASIGFTTGGSAVPVDGTWALLLQEWDETGDVLRSSVNNGTPGTAGAAVNVFFGDPMDIAIGRDFEGTYSGAHLSAHWTLVKRGLTTTERSDLLAGRNPKNLLGSDVLIYLNDNKTAFGATFADVGAGGAVTWTAGDNPAVDEPGGGPGPTITLAQVERGRVLARGLMRGLA